MTTNRIALVDEFPVPLSQPELSEYVEDNKIVEEDPEIGVDVFYEKYVNEIARSDSWVTFKITCSISDRVYIWNTKLGEGISVPTDEWYGANLIEIMALTRESIAQGHDALNEDPLRAGDGCPYCNGEITSSKSGSGFSIKQRCTEGCASHLIG